MIDESNPFYGKARRSARGFGDYTLCIKCNSDTGGWYAKSYIDWAHLGMSILENSSFNPKQIYQFTIKPLNVLKQVLTMFMSADKIGELRKD
jgi:hypothetical protein